MTENLAAPFLAATRQHRLVVQQCNSCQHAQLPPMARCENCGNTGFEWVDASGEGTIASFAIMHRAPPSHAERVPYVYALIDLDEGPRIASNLITDKPSDLRIGQRVRVKFERTDKDGQPWPEFVVQD
ncbi:MAG: Zn-ribbon domain-containing OB-fold protein [Acidimicrobiia bacterium]